MSFYVKYSLRQFLNIHISARHLHAFLEGVDKMQITDIRVRKVLDDGKMKGVVSVTFDNELVIHDIKVIEGKNGYFVAMPSKRLSEGGFKDIAHPINMQSRERLQDAILRAYDEAKSLAEVSADFELE